MVEHFGATGVLKTFIFMFFGRLSTQDNLTSATSSEPVSLFGGD
jgi:hypothetical protein